MPAEHGKRIALTFDDGPNCTTMAQILALLAQYRAKATFFLVGDNITTPTYAILRQAVEQGCELGNHSRTHSAMPGLRDEAITAEIEAVQQQVRQITGAYPRVFRPPYLAVDTRMRRLIPMPFINGYGPADWEDACTVQARIRTVLDGARDGAVVLMHCMEGNHLTVEALGTILPALGREGYAFVTVSELFGAKGITPQNGVTYDAV